jgi:hypothetical protein
VDDTVLFLDHDIEQANVYETTTLHIWAIIGSTNKLTQKQNFLIALAKGKMWIAIHTFIWLQSTHISLPVPRVANAL